MAARELRQENSELKVNNNLFGVLVDINLQATHFRSGSVLLDKASNMNSRNSKTAMYNIAHRITTSLVIEYLQCLPLTALFHTQDGVQGSQLYTEHQTAERAHRDSTIPNHVKITDIVLYIKLIPFAYSLES